MVAATAAQNPTDYCRSTHPDTERHDVRVFVECLVEVAEAVEEDCVGVLCFQFEVLTPRWHELVRR